MTISAVAFPGTLQSSWPVAPAGIGLGQNEIHVWCASVSDFHDAPSRFAAVLSADERTRASKFHLARDRHRFIARRGILRELLARYLHQDAATIEFSVGCFGKPSVAGTDGGLHFNTSHSGSLAVYAVTSVCPVGVDIERLRETPNLDAIASRFFAPAEDSRLAALPPHQRSDEFLVCWTGKEAVLKATGGGLGARCGSRLGVPACVTSSCRLQRLWPAPGYVGALAYAHDAARLSLWSISKATLAGSRPARHG